MRDSLDSGNMPYDNRDPYQAHSFFAASFVCDDCGAELPFPPGQPASDEWCEEFARNARAAGWYVPPAEPGGVVDVWTAYCRACAAKRGLVPNAAV
jgi:hypothetical protein